MKQTHLFTLDLTKMDGSEDFSCPECGNVISPDDLTEEAYSILETKVSSRGLEELVISCKRCTSQLHLTGFSILQKMLELDEKNYGKKTEKEPSRHITHI
jgi:hypothetical protein